MANKSVYDTGGSTPRIMLKRILFLFLLSVICLTLVEAQGVIHTSWGFKHLPAQVFYFKESDINLYLDFRGNVWISSNANGEWKWKEASGVPKNSASALYVHPFSNDKAYILTTGTKHYKTSDKGESWQEFTTEIPPVRKDRGLSFHAHREDFLLFRGTKCDDWMAECTDVTYYTTDGFSTSKKLLENTATCLWAHSSKRFDEAPDHSIFCIQYAVSRDGSMRTYNDFRLVESEDYFENKVVIDFNSGGDVRGVIGLAISQEYLVAAVKDVNSLDMKMYVSTNGQTWARAFFPFNNKDQREIAYTLIESSSENHLIIDVYSSGSSNTGHLFISNSNGTYFVNRLNHTNRNNEGLVDFEHSLSVDGILLANIVSNYKEVDNGSFWAKKLQSKISFDDGITWNFIKPPEKNLGGTDFPCEVVDWEQGTCSLHLHSVTTPGNRGRMYSANAAPGVLMGVGNVGKYLLPYDQCDTLLSYDGGLTWKVVTLGAHMYGIGHYGSILVMVDDEQPTDYISYSYDRGETWKTHYLKQKIRANKIITNPESKNFILFGSAADHDGNSFNKYFAFKLDFSKLFNRDCNDNEFDVWIAKRSGSNCFMGKKTSYYRRKADARCFVSKPPEPEGETCPCTENDFECAPNYIYDKANEKCIPLVPERIPDGECKDGRKKYKGDSGYRIIPDNVCDLGKPGAINLADPVFKSCSEDHSGPPLYGEISHRTTNYDINNYFYFPESSILMIKTNDGKVKRSADGGTTWGDVLTEAGPIAYMFLHDHDSTKAYFFPYNADNNNYYMWYTTNRGESFDKTRLENEPNKLNLPILDFHPKNYDWLLFMAGTTCPGCHSITYFSPDNGKTWKEIETWAEKCIFGKDTEFSGPENDVVFCSSFKYKNSPSQDVLGGKTSKANPLQLVKLKTDSTSKEVLLNNVVQFFIFNEFMAVATEERGQLLLHMSRDGKQFSNAAFPPDISVNKQAYTILQSTTGSVFLDVYKSLNFGYEYGSLFKSNSNGTAFNKILDNTNRNYYGNVDFEKVQGLDGIILANQVENVDDLGVDVKKKVTTLISHDDGFRWKRLTNVKTSDNSDCQDCHLNLYGRTEIRGPGSIFSAPSAIGLLIGVGNFGSYLLPYAECNTFMSRDGGRTWTEIRRGPSLYEFGDQGTIIVMVDDSAPTNHVLYSWNYGNDWAKYIFTNSTPVRVSFLITNSNSTSMKFLLLGRTVPTSASESIPVAVTIDFSQLEKRKCGDADFESWNPMDENSRDHKCLLGEEITYQRRKADVICHIREYEIKPAKRRTCSCTKHDFECAFGYWRNATGGCELMGPDPDRPAYCKNKYKGHSGYVKMEKSKCKGGLNLDEIIDKDCTSEGKIISKMKIFDYRIMDHFYFNETNTILVRTMENIVWQSVDEGYTWKQVKFPSEQEIKIYAMFQHPYFNKYAYFVTLEKTHFYTPDSGANFYELKVPMKPNLLRIPVLDFHPEKPERLIYTGGIDCEHEWSQNCHTEAFYTLDNGKNWNSLETYVRICTWARDKNFKVDSNLIFCESFRDKTGSQKRFENNPLQFVLSTDFFKTKKLRFENIVGSATFEEFMVVAELLPNGQSLRLWVSIDAQNFAEAQFPPNMPITQSAYTVLESITHSVILHVTTSTTNKYGNILKSNGNGTYYSLSLENANRDDRGYVDFEKMQGIQGIALANIVSNTQEVIYGHDKKLKSMITFNDGATWKFLKRPDFDSDGQKYKICNETVDHCSLHLHSYTERRDPKDTFSSSSAIGLMMGVGNVGDYLTPYLEGDTFLTRDAGFTWKEVKKGAYMYEFGDQGAIILLVDDENTTDHVLYSLDEGDSWSEYKFTKVDEPIRVFDIDTMPGGLSSKFILRGYYPQSPNNEAVVFLDFTYIFTRNCTLEVDFEKWSPGHSQDDDSENKCLFGHTITYLRKKQKVQCFVKDDPRLQKEKGQNCVCTEHDFECDYNYMRNATGECELVPGAQPLQRDATEQCANGEEFWYELSGYRKLEVSTCENGPLKYTGESHRCPGRHSALFWIIIVLSPFVIVGILTICIINRRHERLRYSSNGRIRLGSSIEANSILSSIVDIFYQIRMPIFVSRLWSKVPLPGGRRNSYHYSPVATDDGHEVLMDDYDQDNETL